MTTRVIAALWLVAGVVVWNGFFDLYVSRGAREYGQLRVERERDHGPEPDMMAMMARAKHDGVVAPSAWATGIVIAGWSTLWLARRTKH